MRCVASRTPHGCICPGEAWSAWQALSGGDRERFLHLLREAYAQPRRRRENGTAHRVPNADEPRRAQDLEAALQRGHYGELY
jgi:hypothetical protein